MGYLTGLTPLSNRLSLRFAARKGKATPPQGVHGLSIVEDHFERVMAGPGSRKHAGVKEGLRLNRLANQHAMAQQYPEAARLQESAIRLFESEVENGPQKSRAVADADKLRLSQALANRAVLYYHEENQPDKAEPLMIRAMMLKQQVLGENHPALAKTYGEMANMYIHTPKRRGDAIPFLRQALALHQALSSAEAASDHNNLGVLLAETGAREEALEHFHRSAGIAEQHFGPQHDYISRAEFHLGRLYTQSNEFQLADHYLQSALARIGESHMHAGLILRQLGQLHFNQQRYDTAEQFLNRALVAFGKNKPKAFKDVLTLLQKVYQQSGKPAEAIHIQTRLDALATG